MRGGWLSGFGAAGGTMLLLVLAVMIAQPNVRVLDGIKASFDDLLGGEDDEVAVEATVDGIVVEQGRVRGRVHNPSATPLGEVVVRVRLVSPGGGEGRTASATVYGLAPGAEAWFGIPLVGGPAVASAELVDVRAKAGLAAGSSPGARTPARTHLPAPSRRSGVGGMQDVQRQERDMNQMQDAARSVGQ